MSPFLRTLRARVGNALLVLPSVSVLPRDGQRLLMVRLVDTGTWSVIGGTVEPDEDPAAAAVREAREDAGVDVALWSDHHCGGRALVPSGVPER